jgi:hypothetical protein
VVRTARRGRNVPVLPGAALVPGGTTGVLRRRFVPLEDCHDTIVGGEARARPRPLDPICNLSRRPRRPRRPGTAW